MPFVCIGALTCLLLGASSDVGYREGQAKERAKPPAEAPKGTDSLAGTETHSLPPAPKLDERAPLVTQAGASQA